MTSRTGKAESGFTLIEMVVVLAILGLVGGLVLARGPMRSPRLEARAAAGEVAQALRGARARAIALNRPVGFALDVARHAYAVDGGRPQPLPAALALSLRSVAGQLGRAGGDILFAPDGSSTGGRVELAGAGTTLQVGVDWLTGRVSVVDGAAAHGG